VICSEVGEDVRRETNSRGLAHTAKPLGGWVMPARLSSGASRGAAWDRDALVSAARHSACVVLDQCRCDLTQQLGRALDEEDAVMLLRSSSYFERSPALLAATEARRDALEASVADLLGTAWRGIESLLHDSLSTLAERVEHAAREELSERVMTTNKTLSFTHTLSTRPLSPVLPSGSTSRGGHRSDATDRRATRAAGMRGDRDVTGDVPRSFQVNPSHVNKGACGEGLCGTGRTGATRRQPGPRGVGSGAEAAQGCTRGE